MVHGNEMEIKIRNYEEGDAADIVSVFNRAFATNFVQLVRTTKSWKWRYVERPGFKKENVILATANGKIVGSTMVTFRALHFDRDYKFGMIDDVATLPSFRGKGIARKMMMHAVEYMKSENCDASGLFADPSGVAKDLYLALGYENAHFFQTFFRPLNIRQIAMAIPFLAPAAYLFALWRIAELRKTAGDAVFLKPDDAAFLDALNSRYASLAGFAEMDKKFWNWMRVDAPPAHRPVVLAIRRGGKIIGGATLTRHTTAFFGRGLRLGWINEFFSDGDADPLNELIKCGIDAPFLSTLVSCKDKSRIELLRRNLFVKVYEFPIMIKPFLKNFDISAFSGRSWYPIFESAVGFG